MSTDRTTKYVYAVREHIQTVGHATNGELLAILRASFPDVSATTIHRITARMHERGELQLAPSGAANIFRYDANTTPHDHFMCEICGVIRDATLSAQVRPLIEQAIGDGCSISGNLTVSGVCKDCNKGDYE